MEPSDDPVIQLSNDFGFAGQKVFTVTT